VLAPCSPFSVTRELMRLSAVLARERGVSLHTHLAENDNDVAYSREKFKHARRREYAEDLGWVGRRRVACALREARRSRHRAVRAPPAPESRTAPAPTCGWPRASRRSAPCAARAWRSGWASTAARQNDGAHMVGEARQAMLLQRVGYGRRAP
jgi:cytosine/adenosine deaminase-related metal-dependent hydrolase